MANILITADSTFEPFSFERYIKPYEIYTEAYKEAETELEDLSTKSEAIREYVNRDPSSRSASIYNAYTQQLDDEVSRLSSEGLKGTRGRLLQLKRNYNKSIEPIIKKVEHKQKLAAEQREANLRADGALRFDVDYNSNSLDDVDVNKTYSAINLDKITEDTAKQVIAAAKSVINKPEYASAFGDQYIERRLQMGYSMDDILNEIGNLPGAPEELKNIRKNMLDKLNLDNFDNKTISEANSAISNGMMYGVGEIKYELLQNRNFDKQDPNNEENPYGEPVEIPHQDGTIKIFYDKKGKQRATQNGEYINVEIAKQLLKEHTQRLDIATKLGVIKKNPITKKLYANKDYISLDGTMEAQVWNLEGKHTDEPGKRHGWNNVTDDRVVPMVYVPTHVRQGMRESLVEAGLATDTTVGEILNNNFEVVKSKNGKYYRLRFKGFKFDDKKANVPPSNEGEEETEAKKEVGTMQQQDSTAFTESPQPDSVAFASITKSLLDDAFNIKQ